MAITEKQRKIDEIYLKNLKMIDEGTATPSITKGNSKLGNSIYTFSTLPGSKTLKLKDGTELSHIMGTCKGVCEGCDGCEENGCYAIRDAKLHHNVTVPAWEKNTMLLRHNRKRTFELIKYMLNERKAKTLRWNVAGEIDSYGVLLELVQLAKDMPDLNIYFYTKRFNFITLFLGNHPEGFPENLACNISRWHDNTKGYDFEKSDKVNIFAYDDGKDPEIKSWVHCPAVKPDGSRREGITCGSCGRCIKNQGVKTAVYAH